MASRRSAAAPEPWPAPLAASERPVLPASARLAVALVRGGLRALEITLRTPVALDAIRVVARAVPEAIVGAGTVQRADQIAAVEDAGAHFVVSPGTTPALVDALQASRLPALPGVGTVSVKIDDDISPPITVSASG